MSFKPFTTCLSLLLLSIFLPSCDPYLVYHMDLLRPGYLVNTAGKAGVWIVDNSAIQPADYGHSFSQTIPGGETTATNVECPTDSFSRLVVEDLATCLKDQAFYPTVSTIPSNWLPVRKLSSVSFLDASQLNYDQRKALRDSLQQGLLISLDRLLIRTQTALSINFSQYWSSHQVMVQSVWRVWNIEADSLCLEFKHNDTLYWDRYALTGKEALAALPPLPDVVPEVADYVARRVCPVFGPYWESVERWYAVTGSYRMKWAADYVREKDWPSAATLWKEEYEKGWGRAVYRSAMNLVLYYEQMDEPCLRLGVV